MNVPKIKKNRPKPCFSTLRLCAIPPQADAETFFKHATLDAVGCFDGRIFGLCRANRGLVMPLLVNDLQTHHLVGIIKEPLFLVNVPYPKLFRVITAQKG